MSQPTPAYEPLRSTRPIGSWVLESQEGRKLLESEILPRWLPSRRWFGGKARKIERVSLENMLLLAGTSSSVAMIAVHYPGHAPDRYIVPLAYGPRGEFDHESGIVMHDEA